VTYKFGSLSPLQREAKEDAREHNIRAYDWGVETFLTIANSAVDEGDFAEIAHPQLVETSPAGELALALASTSGAPIAAADDDGTTFSEVANPRILRNELGRLASMQQRLEKLAKTEENRHRRHKLKNHIANLHGHIANKRKDFAHKEAAKLVVSCLALGTEKLDVKAMVEQEKREGQTSAQKSGRNREILSAAPAMFNSFVKYKAEEAGTLLVELDTKAIKPSQTCSRCGHKRKKLLSERTHACEKCGLVMGRDRNSAKVMLIHTEEAASQAIAALMLLCGSRDRAVGEGEISPIETPLIA
jgi:DNA-directed RNA polymerase subunit RPC12/RpoP